MGNFWNFLIQNPKVLVSTVAVFVIQLAKAFNVSFDLKAELLDAVTAFIGLVGLIYAGKAKWPKPEEPPK